MRYIYLSIFILSCFLITNKVLSEQKAEHYVAPVPKTFESEINRLALKYNKSPLIAKAVIKCEGLAYKEKGNHRNLDKNGMLWSTDIGWWQINDYYHKIPAMKLGLDINNEWDNLEYGFILWSQQGLAPWSASKNCWSKSI